VAANVAANGEAGDNPDADLIRNKDGDVSFRPPEEGEEVANAATAAK